MKHQNSNEKKLSAADRDELMEILKERFETNMKRHESIKWHDVEKRLMSNPGKLWSLVEMEKSGGEPDVVGKSTDGQIIFFDCCAESPAERRSLCYDAAALAERKANKPKGSAVGAANAMGIELLTIEQYHHLQTLGDFDSKTSSWLHTPERIRKLGGAIFGDLRFDTVFIYHNGAQSYYGSRGFRGVVEF